MQKFGDGRYSLSLDCGREGGVLVTNRDVLKARLTRIVLPVRFSGETDVFDEDKAQVTILSTRGW